MISKLAPVFMLLKEPRAGQVVRTGHVEDIKFVINFDYPNCSEDYVHRIGRTGRSTNTGTAYTFFTPRNSKQAPDLVNVLREANQVISAKLLQLEDGSKHMRGGGGRWRGSGRGGGRFSSGSSFSGGSRSQNGYGNGGFKPANSYSSNGYGSTQNDSGDKYQNGSAGGFKGNWNMGGVTAASLSSIPQPAARF
uniref:Helicase C-terminal domain-containing protein n=1 Tax=Arion vulgaris TaxID=1028688 RepID=A0A0B7AVK6_9EUPU